MYTKLFEHSDISKVSYNIQRTKTILANQQEFLNVILSPSQYQLLVISRFINQTFMIQDIVDDYYLGRIITNDPLNPIKQRPLLKFPKSLFLLENNASIAPYMDRLVLNKDVIKTIAFVKNIRTDNIQITQINSGQYTIVDNAISNGIITGVFIPHINCILFTQNPQLSQIKISYNFLLQEFGYQCRMSPSEFNRTNNKTAYTTSISSSVQVYNPYITTVGLYNDYNQLLAVAKLSQPIKKSSIIQQTIIIQFDYVP